MISPQLQERLNTFDRLSPAWKFQEKVKSLFDYRRMDDKAKSKLEFCKMDGVDVVRGEIGPTGEGRRFYLRMMIYTEASLEKDGYLDMDIDRRWKKSGVLFHDIYEQDMHPEECKTIEAYIEKVRPVPPPVSPAILDQKEVDAYKKKYLS